MEEKQIVTIDLGSQKLAVSVSTPQADGSASLLAYSEFASAGINRGRISNPSRLSVALRKALDCTENYLSTHIVQVGVNLQKYDIRQKEVTMSSSYEEGHSINVEDLENLEGLAWDHAKNENPTEEIVGLVAQSFDVEDDEINIRQKDVVGMMGNRLTGHYKVFSAKSNVYLQIYKAFKDAGIDNVRAVFVPHRAGAAVLTAGEMESGVAVFDLGAGASSVSVFYGGALRHYGAIPFGGNSVTADIQNLCGIDETLAENIKMGYGGCMPDKLESLGEKTIKIHDAASGNKIEITAKYLSEIITARMREIIDALLYELQVSGYADRLKNGIVVVGGGANMLNICHLIKAMSGYNAKVGTPSRKLIKGEFAQFHTASTASSAGLIMEFIGKNELKCTEEVQEEAAKAVEDITKEAASIVEPEPKPEQETRPEPEPEIDLGGLFRHEGEEEEKKEKKDFWRISNVIKKRSEEDAARKREEKARRQAEQKEKAENKDKGFLEGLFGGDYLNDEDPDNQI